MYLAELRRQAVGPGQPRRRLPARPGDSVAVIGKTGRVHDFPGPRHTVRRVGAQQAVQQGRPRSRQTDDEHRSLDRFVLDTWRAGAFGFQLKQGLKQTDYELPYRHTPERRQARFGAIRLEQAGERLPERPVAEVVKASPPPCRELERFKIERGGVESHPAERFTARVERTHTGREAQSSEIHRQIQVFCYHVAGRIVA